eukprot:1711442-Pleurochrysis_carterae.AAC.1
MAVNRRIPAVATLTQSSSFHSVVAIGNPLMVSGRGRSCHACDRCGSGKAAVPPLKSFKQDADRTARVPPERPGRPQRRSGTEDGA